MSGGSMTIYELPATPKQKSAIAKLLTYLGIREPIEDKEMSRSEARDMIYDLRKRLRLRGK